VKDKGAGDLIVRVCLLAAPLDQLMRCVTISS